MYHPLVAMETGFISCNSVLAKNKDLGTRNHVWSQIFSQGWKDQNIKKNWYHTKNTKKYYTSENWMHRATLMEYFIFSTKHMRM